MNRRDNQAGARLLIGWTGLVRRFALAVVLLGLAASAAGLAYSVAEIGINTSTDDMLSPELPFQQNDRALDEAFPQSTKTLSVVVEGDTPELAEDAAVRIAERLGQMPERFQSVFYPENHPFFRQNGLLYLDLGTLQELSDRLAEAQPLLASLSADPSLRGLAEVLRLAIEESGGAMDGTVVPVLDKLAATVERVADGEPARLSWRALMTGEDNPGNDGPDASETRQFVVVQPILNFGSLEPAAQAVAAIKQAAQDLDLTADNGVRVRVTGSPAMLDDELRSVRDGMGLVGLLSLIFVVVLLAIGLRSPRLVLATLFTLIAGLIWTASFATAAIGELNLISVAFAVLFIGLSVDFGIHFALRYKEAIDGGREHAAALAETAGGIGGALTLSAVTAAIGFLAFLPTSYRGVSELGLISGAGMFIALFANLTLLPALLTLMPLKPGRPTGTGLAERLQAIVQRHRRAILVGAVVLGLAATAALPFAWFDDDPFNLRDPDSESVATLLDLLDDPRVQPYDATVLAASLAEADATAARLRQLPEVESAVTLSDLVPAQQDEKLTVIDDMNLFLTPLFMVQQPEPEPDAAAQRQALDDLQRALGRADGGLAAGAGRLAAALRRLPDAAQTLDRLDEALLGDLPRRLDFLADALDAQPVALDDLPAALRDRRLAPDGRATVEVVPAEDLRDIAARRQFVAAVQEVAPGVTGAPVIITEAGRAVIESFREAALLAFVLIVLLLLVVLRSLRDAAMILSPLVLATLLTVAGTVVLRQPFNFANVIVLPLLFGLGVAFGIQIVLRGRSAGAGRLMRSSTPRAVAFSALTTMGSFGALALSSHRGTASMGQLLTLAITITMLCTLIVLPALLTVAARREAAKAPAGGTADGAPDEPR